MFGNWLRTASLMAGIMALFAVIGASIAGPQGMIVALALAAIGNLVAYWFSDRMVLRMYRAQPADETSAPQFYRLVTELANRAGLPMPKVYLIDAAQPNAFATGRNPRNAAVAATTGILQLLTVRELRGVMAHELAHIRHRDILTSTISATLAGAIAWFARFGRAAGASARGNPVGSVLALVFAPVAAMLIQFAISRAREFEADRGGADIAGDPNALADALAKLDECASGLPLESAESHPATAQMMIINPLSAGGLRGLFSTHPDTAERIARLRAMAR